MGESTREPLYRGWRKAVAMAIGRNLKPIDALSKELAFPAAELELCRCKENCNVTDITTT
jgi:hypothetical protein